MNSDNNLKTYLLVSPKKISILVKEELNLEEIYKNEILVNNESNLIKWEFLKHFLNENIFKIEKTFKRFIKNIYLIIDTDNFLSIKISIKKKNHNNIIDSKNLIYLLNEAKDQCQKTLENQRIVHTTIENYLIDNISYSFLPENKECDNFCLDIRFICFSDKFVKNLENILKKYHISVNQVVSVEYLNQYFSQNEHKIFDMAEKIIDGCNENEIIFIDKTTKNKGFFEKFFNLFS
tara:strand:- start:10982 stop:11686 length:705 start_codon:yes stop_codon:yes gene_type:complete